MPCDTLQRVEQQKNSKADGVYHRAGADHLENLIAIRNPRLISFVVQVAMSSDALDASDARMNKM